MTIHDDIDGYLVADLHNELSEQERNELHTHLVECANCRQAHQENKIMNKVLEENLTTEKADPTFEQRMLAGFRNRVPQRSGFVKLIVDLMRLRATQITAVAALLLVFVGVGRLLTLEKSYLGNEEVDFTRMALTEGRLPKQNTPVEGLRQLPSYVGQATTENDSSGKTERRRVAIANSNLPTAAAEGKLPVTVYSAEVTSKAGAAAAPPDALHYQPQEATTERVVTTGSYIPTSETESALPPEPAPGGAKRKLVRNAQIELEVGSFEESAAKIVIFANEDRGYVVTSKSEKQANGKLSGEVVVKVLPESLDKFLLKLRGLGEVKNQTLGTEDITKAYFDTDSRLKNSRVMEQRLIDMLKTKTGKVADLLAVEKELGRVREEIEKMQGDLKFWDSQVQLSTVTITLTEKDMEEPAAFLLKESAQLALYAPEVEKIYNDIKSLASPKVQITDAQMDRDNSGKISARISLLIVPEESEAVIARVKGMGRVENFQVRSERVAEGGSGMSANAKTKRDKVVLNVTLSRDEQEFAYQQTTLRIRTSAVDEKAKQLRTLAEKQSGRVRSSSFSRDSQGREFSSVSVRVSMTNYPALMQSLSSLGKLEDISIARENRTGAQVDEANAPADLSIQIYSPGFIVSDDAGIMATLRRTIGQGAGALMWSLRMIGVALAFFAPWVIALVGTIWIVRRIRARRKL